MGNPTPVFSLLLGLRWRTQGHPALPQEGGEQELFPRRGRAESRIPSPGGGRAGSLPQEGASRSLEDRCCLFHFLSSLTHLPPRSCLDSQPRREEVP